jgi:hypothetical protein
MLTTAEPMLFDAVTLRHFAAAEALDVCRRLVEDRDPPRWTDAVSAEIAAGLSLGIDECVSVQECAWLGAPIEPEVLDLASIVRLQRALSESSAAQGNAGEAESIYFAERLGALFATDDGLAFDLACRRLGCDHVVDTVDLLKQAVAESIITSQEAADYAARVTDSGRHLRRGRDRYPGSTFFEMN